jgi:hypothetical protein
MSEHGDERIDIAQLLTIDVASELRKLTQAQLQGPWQLPAELVRRAIRNRARRIEIELGRNVLRVHDDGDGLALETLERLAILLDPGHDSADRHAALTGLEQAGALALLAVAGLEPDRVRLVTETPAGPRVLDYRRRDATASVRPFSPPVPAGTTLEVSGARLDRSRARNWLASVCRFTPADVILDGQPVPRGFPDSISRRPLDPPLRGLVSIPREGDDARAWLLQDGVVSTHVTVTPAPCFEAAVEMRDLSTGDATAASLRDAIERHLDALIEQAVSHLITLGESPGARSERTRQRVAQLLLEAARQRRFAADVARLPLFRGFERNDADELIPTWFDLVTIRGAIEPEAGERTVVALFPDQEPADFAIGARAFVLDEAERSLLGDLLSLRFRQPRRKEGSGPWGRTLGAALRAIGDASQTLLAALWRKRPIDEDELTPQERRFLEVIRSALGGQRTGGSAIREISICEGEGRIRRARDVVWLPRHNPEVLACIEAVSKDPSWAYPALLTLLGGRALPSAHTRFVWTQARSAR